MVPSDYRRSGLGSRSRGMAGDSGFTGSVSLAPARARLLALRAQGRPHPRLVVILVVMAQPGLVGIVLLCVAAVFCLAVIVVIVFGVLWFTKRKDD